MGDILMPNGSADAYNNNGSAAAAVLCLTRGSLLPLPPRLARLLQKAESRSNTAFEQARGAARLAPVPRLTPVPRHLTAPGRTRSPPVPRTTPLHAGACRDGCLASTSARNLIVRCRWRIADLLHRHVRD